MKKHHYLFLLCTGIFMLCSRCTRTDLPQDITAVSVHRLTNEWLNSRIREGETERNERIELIRQNVLPSRAFAETLEDGEKLIIVPMAAGFKMNHNRDKNADHYLLLFENKSKEVYKGNIVQFIPLNAQQKTLPGNTLSRLWNCKNVTANGTFTVLTIFDKHLYEVDFKDGFKKRYAEMKEGKKRRNSTKPDNMVTNEGDTYCIEWYLETTTYYSDGTKEKTTEYLGTTCYPGQCRPGEQCSVIAPEDYGGQPNNPDEEVEAMKTLVWHVYNPSGPINDTAHGYGINSIETVKFKRNVSAPQGGYFTSISHNTSDCNMWNTIYLEDENKVSAMNQTATSRVKGHYIKENIRRDIDNSRSWQLSEIK